MSDPDQLPLFPEESPGTDGGPDAEDGELMEEVVERNYPTPEELELGIPEPDAHGA